MRGTPHPPDRRGLYAVIFTGLVALSVCCGNSDPRELNRARALELLESSKTFKTPALLPLRDVEKFNIPASSADEEPVPHERAVETYFENYPDMGVLRELGLVEAEATLIDRPQLLPATGQLLGWRFLINVRPTAKGREFAQAAGGTGEDAIPLFRREILEVSGVTKESENRARAEFTWRAVPTPVGEAFDPKSRAFKNLPAKLQQKVSQPTLLGDSLKLQFGETRKAVGYFQLYDDGWRVDYIQ